MKAGRLIRNSDRLMKSKPLLLLLGLSLSVMCVWGQSPSYIVNIAPGGNYTLFANQLALNPNDLENTQLGLTLSKQAQVLTWNVAAQSFQVYSKLAVPLTWNADPALTVGEGFFCRNPNGAQPGPLPVTFAGTASTTPVAIPNFTPATLYYLLGSQTYSSTLGATYNYQDITGYLTPGITGVSLYRARNSVPGGTLINSFPGNSLTDWNEYWFDGTSWHPSDPQIYLGEAVWVGPSMCAIEGTAVDFTTGQPLANWEITLSDGQVVFTDANGFYRFAVPSTGGEYTIAQIPQCGWDTMTDPQSVTLSCPGPTTVSPFMAVRQTAGANAGPDLAATVIYVPDPGNHFFPCLNDTGSYVVYYYNKCGAIVPAGSTLVVALSGYVTYGNAGNPSWTQTPPAGGSPASLNAGTTYTWTLGALPPGAIGSIQIPILVTGPLATSHPFTSLATTATIQPVATDANPVDNNYQIDTLARCSFDPNDKAVDPPGCGPAGLINGNQLLTYTVQFQNLGSAPAFDVVVTDQLDPSLDPSTLKLLNASHHFVFNLVGNQMTWTFPNITLPDAAENALGSHGFFSYQVKPLPSLAEGTVITNQASVVFDKNPAVLTATTTNTITSATLASASFTVAPRPGSAGHTNDFTYTGGTAGATFYWDFGPDAIPPTSTDMNPSGVVFPANGLRTMNLQVASGDCTDTSVTRLLSVGKPVLNIASTGTNQFVLSWQGDGYSLQQAGTLSDPVPWQSISLPLTQIGVTYFTPPLAITNAMTFYRLTDQP